ncbi:MAG: amidohydrolase [Alcanivoracaceae bacterium]|nr:amidohydrolase [Alcanivoracaceae bacterium]
MKTNIIIICIFMAISLSSVAEVSIIHNVQGNTINQDKQITFSALAFDNGKVLSIGSKDKLLVNYPDALLIDGQGHAMLPGLHDAHGHVLGLANLKNEIDLMGVTTIEESLKIIQQFIDEHPQNNWILGRGWNQVLWENKKFPSYKDLDKLKTNKPIWLRRVDGHAGWANSKAMEIAKSNKHLKDMPGGEIIIDEQGIQSGIFIDNAMNIIQSHISREQLTKTDELIYKTLNYLASIGITSVDDAGIDWPTYDSYKKLSAEHRLPIRINAMLASGSQVLDKMLSDGIHKDDFLQIQTIKYVADGALGSRGAAMIAPYNDRTDTSGKQVQSQGFIQKHIFDNAENGWQAAIHAIGDNANRISIEILADEKANTKILRHRIEHAQIVDFADLAKFKQYNIIASMQPTHATSDMNMAEDRVGRERLRGAYAWQTLIKKGVIIASGSDFPVELANPFYGLHAAITRQDRNNQPENGWIAIEKMTVKQALASFTINAAYANHRENSIGSLESGKWADFILVNQNIFETPPQNIWQTQVIQTWVAGQKIFDKAINSK